MNILHVVIVMCECVCVLTQINKSVACHLRTVSPVALVVINNFNRISDFQITESAAPSSPALGNGVFVGLVGPTLPGSPSPWEGQQAGLVVAEACVVGTVQEGGGTQVKEEHIWFPKPCPFDQLTEQQQRTAW